jgi:hypothetical protein
MDQVDEGILADDAYTQYSLSESERPLLGTSVPTRTSTTLVAWITLQSTYFTAWLGASAGDPGISLGHQRTPTRASHTWHVGQYLFGAGRSKHAG